VAIINGSYSFVTDTPDFWRRAHADYPSHGDRFTGEPAYFKHVTGAAERLMESLGTTAADYRGPSSTSPTSSSRSGRPSCWASARSRSRRGCSAAASATPTPARTMIGLTAILDVAEPGDRILMVSYGSGAGSDAFDIVVTDKLPEVRHLATTTEAYISRRTEINYATYTRYRDKLKLN
jgi:hydroxymethylglutaryl-CoA synthase